MAKHKGKILNQQYGRGAKEARYRANGIWYHLLTAFPADLYDSEGVVRFDSETTYKTYVRIGPNPESTHADVVGKGIAYIPGYTKLSPPPGSLV